jgi:hypothetical protein
MQGLIRIVLGMTLLIIVGGLDDTLPTATFLLSATLLAVPGLLLIIWGMLAQYD